jgi:hypothetical protein
LLFALRRPNAANRGGAPTRRRFCDEQQGFTMEAIATQLGVNHGTISRDIREFVHDAQI